MGRLPSKAGLIETAKLLARPIDFEELVKAGVIEKAGAWFKVKSLEALPRHVSGQVRSVKSDGSGTYVKLPKSWKRAQEVCRRLAGQH